MTNPAEPDDPGELPQQDQHRQQQQQQQQPKRNGHHQAVASAHQMERFARVRELVRQAIAARHTFTIHGRSRIVRDCLLARGWCEKFHQRKPAGVGSDSQQQQQQQPPGSGPTLGVDSNPASLLAGVGDLDEPANERLLISRMLGNHTVDLLWNAGSEWTGWPSQDNKTTIFNRYTRASFTSKIGLCCNVRQMHWHYEPGVANTLFPRCYNVGQQEQMHAFIEDYRLTACLGMLKCLVDNHEGCAAAGHGSSFGGGDAGVVPLRALDFAMARVSDFVGSKSHEDLDQDFDKVWSHQWEQFVGWYYKIAHGLGSFLGTGGGGGGGGGSSSASQSLSKYVLAARHLLKRARKHWPQLDMDGTRNLWILKPGNKSRGRGIVLMNKLDDILAKVNPNRAGSGPGSAAGPTDTRFVVQKYIERPLLVYDTKFDIRQWFIVTCAQPLTLWMYKESYLRFCSQRFSLTDFHESIHLSNNAVQCKYKNSPERDPGLPSDNMWDVAAFKDYLRRTRGDEDAWERLVYPGMRQGLVGSLLASQEAMDRRKNSFELYGADFMLMEDYSVWLIEINSHPDMSSSTSVTARLCRQAMEDTIKVVVDYRENPAADTGGFELAYRQRMPPCQAHLGSGLFLHGSRIQAPAGPGSVDASSSSSKRLLQEPPLKPPAGKRPEPGPRVGPVLVDLLEALELRLDHEFFEYLKLRSSSCGLSRRGLPSARRGLQESAPRSGQPSRDVETNTNLLFLSSEVAAASAAVGALGSPGTSSTGIQRIVTGGLSTRSGSYAGAGTGNKRGSYAHRKSCRNRENIGQTVKSSENAVQGRVKSLAPKIVDLQRDAPGSKQQVGTTPNKLYHLAKISENAEATENSASKRKKAEGKKLSRASNRSRDSGPVPVPSRLKTTSNATEREAKSSRSTNNSKPNHVKKKSRVKSSGVGGGSQVFVDVTDMYAVGLAVNKDGGQSVGPVRK